MGLGDDEIDREEGNSSVNSFMFLNKQLNSNPTQQQMAPTLNEIFAEFFNFDVFMLSPPSPDHTVGAIKCRGHAMRQLYQLVSITACEIAKLFPPSRSQPEPH